MTTAPVCLGDDIEDTIADLAGVHPLVDQIIDALAALAAAPLSVDETQTVIAGLAATPGADLVSLIARVMQRLANPATNPAMTGLPAERQYHARWWADHAANRLLNPAVHQPAAEAIAALDLTQPLQTPDPDTV